jgi:hypothetical protein
MYLIYILFISFYLIFLWIRKSNNNKNIYKTHIEREEANLPKILYLRAFNVDGDDGSNGNISILGLLPKEMDLAKTLIKFEYQLIAVGKPDEELPEIGFYRKKFDHSIWQEEVLKLMEESKLIIWRPDHTPGVLWEIGKLLELNYRHKLVVWAEMGYENLQGVQEARYNVFKRKAFEQFSEIFPPFNKYKKFLVSEIKDNWSYTYSIQETPIYKQIKR